MAVRKPLVLISGRTKELPGADSLAIPFSWLTGTPTTLAGYGISDAALDSTVVHNTGTETVAGQKTFSNTSTILGGGASAAQLHVRGGAGTVSDLILSEGSDLRWLIRKQSAAANDLQFMSYDDAGTQTLRATWARDTGILSFNSAGIAFGSSVVSAFNDLTRHISLHGTGYGFSVTSGRLNYNLAASGTHDFYVGTSLLYRIDDVGMTMNKPLSVTGAFTGAERQEIALLNTDTSTGSIAYVGMRSGTGGTHNIGAYAPEYTIIAAFTGRLGLNGADNGVHYAASGASGTHTWSTGASYVEKMRLTNAGFLEFLTTGQRIRGDFTGATLANRLMFQTTTANSSSNVGVIPLGTGTTALWAAYNSSDPDNAGIAHFRMEPTLMVLGSTKTGTGTVRPMSFQFDSVEKASLGTTGIWTTQSYMQSKGALAGYSFDDRTTPANVATWYQDGNIVRLFNVGGSTVDNFRVDSTGRVYGGSNGSLELGYRNVPLTTQNADYTFVASDAGKGRMKTDTTLRNYTVNNSIFAGGDMLTVLNNSATANIVLIAGSGVTMRLAGTTTTGNRTVPPLSWATIFFASASGCYVAGPGVT